MKRIRVALGQRSYDIVIGNGILARAGALLKSIRPGSDAVVITNGRLHTLYGKILRSSLEKSGFTVRFELVPDSEKAKSIGIAARLLGRIARYDVRRRLFIIALGGGVVGDLAGFVASVYKRGVPFVQIPTTLLAQVDSAIGGKVAIDLPVAKNLVGSFYQPRIVISDVATLRTLSRRQIQSGLAEVIKYGAIKDPALFRFLEKTVGKILKRDIAALEYVVTRSAAIKARVVAMDELDRTGLRAVLNFGHTAGHAIEAAEGYGDLYNHGEAISVGMVVASDIATALGMIKKADALRLESVIEKAGLPVEVRGVRCADIYKAHLHDKKFIRGKNRFILPLAIGRVRVVEDVPERIVKGCIRARTF